MRTDDVYTCFDGIDFYRGGIVEGVGVADFGEGAVNMCRVNVYRVTFLMFCERERNNNVSRGGLFLTLGAATF